MAKTIEMDTIGTCEVCGSTLQIGDKAKKYGTGKNAKFYGIDCHTDERTDIEKIEDKIKACERKKEWMDKQIDGYRDKITLLKMKAKEEAETLKEAEKREKETAKATPKKRGRKAKASPVKTDDTPAVETAPMADLEKRVAGLEGGISAILAKLG